MQFLLQYLQQTTHSLLRDNFALFIAFLVDASLPEIDRRIIFSVPFCPEIKYFIAMSTCEGLWAYEA